MARITCRTPSTGKSLKILKADVPTTYTTIAEAPDFSVPDTSNKFTARDSADTTRAIRPGEVFFLTPMACRNKTATVQKLTTRLVSEDGIIIELGEIEVPAYDTGFVPVQGRSLLKRTPHGNVNGDRLQIKAQADSSFDIWLSGEEKLSAEHTGVQ